MDSKFLSGCIGASVAEIVTLPICTIKTCYQGGNSQSYLETIKHVYRRGGMLEFYRASIPAISAQVFTSAYKITVFEYLKTKICLEKAQNIYYLMLAGLISSITCLMFTHPLDYFRVSLQVNRQIHLKDIYKGIGPALMKNTLGGITFLPLRQFLKNYFPDQETWKLGLIAAIISTIIVHPFDFFKTFLLANTRGSKIPFRNPYRGLTINLCRIVPHFVIMTEIAEKLKL